MNPEFKIKLYFLFSNVLIVNIAFGIVNLIIFDTFFVPGWAYPSLLIFINFIAILSFFISNYHSINYSYSPKAIYRVSTEYLFFFIFFVLTFWFSVNSTKYFRIHLLLFITFYAILNFANVWRYILKLRKLINPNQLRRVLLIGFNHSSQDLINYVKNNKWCGYAIDCIIEKEQFLVNKYENQSKYNEIFVNSQVTIIDDRLINQLKFYAEEFLIDVKIFNSLFSNSISKKVSNYIGDIPLIKLFYYPLDSYLNRTIKRVFDIFLSIIIVLFFFTWLFPIIALLIYIDNPGPIFYKQKRHGHMNNIFNCIKFRSMKVDKNEKFVQAKKNDIRITKVGKWIRKLNIDELPQIFNVLLGEMSIVGPRPHPIDLNKNFSSKIDKYYFRHLSKPGITGLAQIKGFRGETDTLEKMHNRVKYDRYYIQNWTFTFDLIIIFLTIYNMVKGEKNAY